MTVDLPLRLTQYAAGGGCACKVPPGELERVLAGLPGGRVGADLMVGVENGDDAAVVRIDGERAVVVTADFFTPVVDDLYDWGRIAAANALSDVYAMGGEPLVAVNLLAWPRDDLPFDLAAEVLRGGADVASEAACFVAGGHSIDDREPKYGMAVTGLADPERLLRNDAGVAGTPLTLTKPLGLGILNNRHKSTGEVFDEAVATMTALNRDASRAAVERESSARPTSPVSGCSVTCSSSAARVASEPRSTPARCRTSTAPARPWRRASSREAPGATSSGCARTW